ncbi:MAG TPA: hypothetical protein VIL46_09815 [Gemmataceae bacterium]
MRSCHPPRPAAPRAAGLVALLPLALAGCESGPTGPETFPVKGQVIAEKGADLRNLVGGTVEFKSASDPSTRAYGEIKEDGTFVMATQKDGVGKEGAVAGEHHVRIVLNIEDNDDNERPVRPPIHPRYLTFDKSGITCNVPQDQELMIRVSR